MNTHLETPCHGVSTIISHVDTTYKDWRMIRLLALKPWPYKKLWNNSFLSAGLVLSLTAATFGSYLTAKGSKLYNDHGEVVRLTGVNWFGFETTNMFPHGLWARDYHGVLLQIRKMGFNCIRLPFCNEMLRDDAKPDKPNFYGEDPFYQRDKTEFNKELIDLTPLQMMDEIIRFAGVLGLVIILDNHSREHDGYMNEKLWYTSKTSERAWIDDWVMLAKRYKNNPTVTGFDLDNEPHGKITEDGSTWAIGNAATDWNVAAQKCGNAILAENPDVLVIIEGVQQYDSTVYWWGGNLRGVKKQPIVLSKPDKLVYSPHEYGPEVFQQPWFFQDDFPANMEVIWDNAFGYIAKENIAPLLVGEFGISSMDSYQGKAGVWLKTFVKYLIDNVISWTFWALNPNSGDTGGMLDNDWVSEVQWKLDEVKSMRAPLINQPMSVRRGAAPAASKRCAFHIKNNILLFGNEWKSGVAIDLVNLHGEVVRSAKESSLPLEHIAAGTYVVSLRNNYRIEQTARIIIQ
jgi:endoglucanase